MLHDWIWVCVWRHLNNFLLKSFLLHKHIMLGMCYIHSTTSHARGGVTGGEIATPVCCVGHNVWGGGSPTCWGLGQCPGIFFLVLIFRWADLPMVLCMFLHMVFGYDGFRPLVFCRSSQGNYGYVII